MLILNIENLYTPIYLFRSFIFCILTCAFLGVSTRAFTEPLYRAPNRDSANTLLKIIARTKPDTTQVKLYLNLIEYYITQDYDTAAVYINKALLLSRRLQFKYGEAMSLCMEAIIRYDIPDSLAAPKLFNEAITIARQTGNINLEALIWYKRADIYSTRLNDDTRLEYFTRSRDLYRRAGNKINEAYLLKCMADCRFRLGKPVASLKELLEAIEIYRAAGYKKLHYAYDLTGAVYKSMGNYEEALSYAIAALKSSLITKDTVDLDLFYIRFGNIYRELGLYDNAIANYKIALERSKTVELVNHKYYTFYAKNLVGSIAECLANSGKPREGLDFFLKYTEAYRLRDGGNANSDDAYFLGKLYMMLKKYAIAEKYYLQWFATNTAGGRPAGTGALLYLGNFYVTVNQFSKARPFLTQALKSVSVNSSYQLPQVHQLLFRVDSAAGDYIAAIRHYQVYKTITDTIFNEKKINQLASLQLKFETEKKDQDISLLTAQTKEQQVELKKQELQRNAMLAGAAMLLLLVWFVYSRYRVKNKTALQLETQQEIINNKNKKLEELLAEKEELLAAKNELITEKEWLLKEVHHRVKNNLQMVMTLLYTQSAYLKDQQALDAITESQHRIHAISLIHQKLYQSDNLQLINMKGYIHELVDNLKESFDKEDDIEITLDIEPLELDVSKSIPIGLMLNEAVTNALKYAFKNGSRKIIAISLLRETQEQFVLTVKDNGKGLPASFDPLQAKTLGLKLIEGLCKQIKAKYAIESDHGVSIIIRFSNTTDNEPEQNNPQFENI